ncbi:hypothetical protein [Actinomyces capricornis]|uniref:Uncharacterized protein n=1 Tax=Actinomyces capricornis TaxID=2755559 RepID=A0ABN6K1U7_9ACTO|nr:hypothetical protein [Actinomyces capricornis]BDA63569.1 hypothetical protein MANAM107_04030 [Actinomyces capricornis]
MSAATSSLEEPPPVWHRSGDLILDDGLPLKQILLLLARRIVRL